MRTLRRSHAATLQKVQVILKSTSRTAPERSSRAPTPPVGRCGCSAWARTASSARATATWNPSGYFEKLKNGDRPHFPAGCAEQRKMGSAPIFENYGTCWNGEVALLPCPPLTVAASPPAELPSPPVTLAMSPFAKFPRPPLTLEATAVVMFPCPPLMLEESPPAKLPAPPVTLEKSPLAALFVPPATLAPRPLAMFLTPAANAETPSSVLAAPAARPPCLVKLCCPPTMRLCDPVRLTASRSEEHTS